MYSTTIFRWKGISGVTTVPLVIINEFFKQVIQMSHTKTAIVMEIFHSDWITPPPPMFLADQKQSEIQILNTILDNRIP